jgi:hypothetical protein
MEAYASEAFAVQGKQLKINVEINNRQGKNVKLDNVRVGDFDTVINKTTEKNQNITFFKNIFVDENKPVSQPYWLREKMNKGSFNINDPELTGTPQSPPPYEVTFRFTIEGQEISYSRPVLFKHTDPVKGEVYQPLTVLPSTGSAMKYGTLKHIRYEHIPDIYYFNTDTFTIKLNGIKTDGKKIGYIEGAGDKVPAALNLMGYEVTFLKEKDLNAEYLKQFDAIITGVRAFNVHDYLTEKNKVLNEYVSNGGNLVVQYNTNSFVGPNRATIGPLPFRISRERITDENSPVKFLLPGHQVLNYPNKISQADFENWVQERGIYFADELDPAFQTPIAMNDPGEKDLKGSLVIADYGKGKFVYTGLVFFRQLPAGVTGAYRILANIIALNKKPE